MRQVTVFANERAGVALAEVIISVIVKHLVVRMKFSSGHGLALNRTDNLSIGGKVYPAFRLVGSGPATGARIIIRTAERRAGFAADRTVTHELEGVRRQMMAVHVRLNVESREPGKRFNLQPVIGDADIIQVSPGRAMET